MLWDSVVSLKAQLRAECLVPEPNTRTASVRPAGQVLAPTRPRLAVGASPTGAQGQFRLALRPMDSSPATLAVVKRAMRLARNETDLVEVGIVRASRPAAARFERVRPLAPGCSIGHEGVTAGTLGAFVVREGRPLLLSNAHVLVRDANPCTAAILQPGPHDGGSSPTDRIGALANWSRLCTNHPLELDAAVASVETSFRTDFAGVKLRGWWTETVPLGTRVWKIGRTTHVTSGVVRVVGLDDLRVEYDDGPRIFEGQIEIEGNGGAFSRGGDSGAVILDEQGAAVALLFASSTGANRTFATPIHAVLEFFNVQLAA